MNNQKSVITTSSSIKDKDVEQLNVKHEMASLSKWQLVHKIPLAVFFLTMTVALAIGFTFYIKSEELIKQQEFDKLMLESQIVLPVLSDFYQQSALDASFLAHTPPIQNILKAKKHGNSQELTMWREQLSDIFYELLKTKSVYRRVSFFSVFNKVDSQAVVFRKDNTLFKVPLSELKPNTNLSYLAQAKQREKGETYFSNLYITNELGLSKGKHSFKVAHSIFDDNSGSLIGILTIEVDFDAFIEKLTNSSLKNLPFYLADHTGKAIFFSGQSSSFKDFYLITDLFPQVEEVTSGSKSEMKFDSYSANNKYLLGYISQIKLDEFPTIKPLYLLLENSTDHYILAAQNMRYSALVIGSVLALICFFLSIYASRKLTKPLRDITASLSEFQKTGEVRDLPINDRDEIGILARGFQNLLVRIQEKSVQQYQTMSKAQVATAKLEAVLNSIADAVININEQGLILSFNKAAEKLFGYQEKEVFGKNVSMLMPFEYSINHDSYLINHLKTGSSAIIGVGRELPAIRKDGEKFSMFLNVSSVETEEGIIFTGLIRDITASKILDAERKRVFNEAKEAAWRLDFALSAPGIGVWDFNLQHKTTSWDSRMFKLFDSDPNCGLRPDDIWEKMIHPEDLNKVRLLLKQCELDGQDLNFQYRIITARKSIKTIETHAQVMYDDNGRKQRIVGTNRDITEQIAIEKIKEEALVIAEESLRLKSEFLASMSHEIRTPMNGVLGMLNLLDQSDLSRQQKRHVQLASSSAQSLLTLINDILDFSKIEAGKLELEILDFDIRNQFGDFAESMAVKAQEKGVELILDLTKVQSSLVKGDPSRLRQILTNLVSNAIKFTDEGEIVIKAAITEVNHKIHLSCQVIDTGIGIPKEKIADLFDSFTQVDASTTRKYGGTGLGLAIVKQLCQLMGGSVSVVSETGKGSCFSFELKLDKSKQSTIVMPNTDIKGTKILIVDDNTTNLAVLKGQLEIWGAIVTEAIDGFEALNIIERSEDNEFSVAILDMQMPGMDGATLGKSIHNHVKCKKTKMIMMTSMSERGDTEFFASLGFSAYFPKPATTSDLFDALSLVLDETGFNSSENNTPIVTSHLLRSAQKGSQQESIREDARILLVEDNRINQAVLLGILSNINLKADVANNGVEALTMLQQSPKEAAYQVVIMDCQMPEMDGYQATGEIRKGVAGERYKSIPVIAMTANAMVGDREKCLASGMNDYATKPVDATIIFEKLLHWLPKNSVISRDDLTTFQPKTQTKEQEEIIDSEENIELLSWDKDSFFKRIKDNQTIAERLIALFLEDIPILIDELIASLNKNDSQQIKALSHKLKGSAKNISADKLANVAQDIEFYIFDKNHNHTASELISALQLEFDLLKEKFKTLKLGS